MIYGNDTSLDYGMIKGTNNSNNNDAEMIAHTAGTRFPLFDDYSFGILDDQAFLPLLEQYRAQVFANTLTFSAWEALNASEQKALESWQQHADSLVRLNLVLYQGDAFIGWSWGRQLDQETFYMASSALLEPWRRKGIYSELLRWLLAHLQTQGVQIVRSRHLATDNAIIIPKLKAGFVMTGMELSDVAGTLVQLSYFFNERRRQMLDFRAGFRLEDRGLLEHLSL
ncbi:GNAT family N-acetyltransferase [Kistimonas asteriae]|uniref:GNAT family N-acetyltransferase n=1 Tax=Kistimonas asteriae TaxID=517724 RepID=UPI001BACB02A|nr:GNAT family N-acetyltransferase [Kistimonas asteriae]